MIQKSVSLLTHSGANSSKSKSLSSLDVLFMFRPKAQFWKKKYLAPSMTGKLNKSESTPVLRPFLFIEIFLK